MSRQASLSFATGRDLRDAGIERALENANEQIDNWSDIAYSALQVFVALHPDQTFMAEDVRNYAYDHLAIPYPPHCRAWGGVMLRASRQGLIRKVGVEPVKTPSNHMANAAVWEKVP